MNCSKKESEFHFLPHLTNNFGKFLGFQVFYGHDAKQHNNLPLFALITYLSRTRSRVLIEKMRSVGQYPRRKPI